MEAASDHVRDQPRAAAENPRPHVLAFPFPLLGHIKPVVQLCKFLIAKAGCRVTVACCETAKPFLQRLLPTTLDHMTLLPLSNPLHLDASGPPYNWDSSRALLCSWFDVLPRSFALHVSSFSDVVCVISDVYLTWAADVADQLCVPHLAQWISASAELQVYLHAEELVRAGKLPFKAPPGTEEKGWDNMLPAFEGTPPLYHRVQGKLEEETEIELPGLPALTRRDFPTFLQIEDASDMLFSLFSQNVKTTRTASMVLINSFEALDCRVLDAMKSQGIRAHPIGPLTLTEDAFVNEKGPSMEEQECLNWLDCQKPESVLFVAFGSIVQLDKAQIRELALGLLKSGQPFIWVCPNSDIGPSKERTIAGLPKGFLDQVKNRALLLNWAPQIRILGHPSTGGFLTHCGWNSTTEAICCGVPTLCLPFVTDQTLICKMVVEEWKVGLRLERRSNDGIAIAEDIERLTRELFQGELGNSLRKRAQVLKRAAHVALQDGGSSRLALEAILNIFKWELSSWPSSLLQHAFMAFFTPSTCMTTCKWFMFGNLSYLKDGKLCEGACTFHGIFSGEYGLLIYNF